MAKGEDIEPKKKTGMKIFIVIAGLVVLISTIILLLVVIQIPYTAKVVYTEKEPYEATETYEEEVPYTETEYYERNLEYKSTPLYYPTSTCIEEKNCGRWSQICVKKNFWGNCVEWEDRCDYWKCSKERKTCNYYIKNLDDYYGVWQIGATIKNRDTGTSEYLGQKPAYLYKMDETTLTWSFETSRLDDVYYCEYDMNRIPTISEGEEKIRYKTVKKERPITKYRDVEKTEEVTRYCSAWNRISGVC